MWGEDLRRMTAGTWIRKSLYSVIYGKLKKRHRPSPGEKRGGEGGDLDTQLNSSAG